MADKDITGDLSYVLEEAEVERLVLEPCDLQVAVDVSTVGVPVSKIPVVVLFVGRNGEAAIGSNANCKRDEEIFITHLPKIEMSIYVGA